MVHQPAAVNGLPVIEGGSRASSTKAVRATREPTILLAQASVAITSPIHAASAPRSIFAAIDVTAAQCEVCSPS